MIDDLKLKIDCRQFLEKSKNGLYVCPFCGSGTGKNRTGALKYFESDNKCVCFGRCGKKAYSVIDIYMQIKGVDFKQATKDLEQENFSSLSATVPKQEPKPTKEDFTAYLKKCKKNLHDNPQPIEDYLESRGFKRDIWKTWERSVLIGYDTNYPGLGECMVYSNNRFSFTCRALIEPTDKSKRYRNRGAKMIFNLDKVNDNETVFVCEGFFDCMSIQESGFKAISIDSINNADKFMSNITTKGNRWIICFDTDEKKQGEEVAQALKAKLKEKGEICIVGNVNGTHKDINELYQKNPGELKRLCGIAYKQAEGAEEGADANEQRTNTEKGANNNLLTYEKILESLEQNDGKYIEIPGFKSLSKVLRLKMNNQFVISADTGLGKSTLALNWLYGLSKDYQCIYFNLEMNKRIVNNRLLAIDSGIEVHNIENFKNMDEQTQGEVLKSAKNIADRSIIVYNDKFKIDDIIKTIKEYKDEKCIVVVDHIHLIQSDKATPYEQMKEISGAFKDLYNTQEVCLILVAQQNREGKKDNKKPTLGSLKECGSLENDATQVGFLYDDEKKGLVFIVLKNREGELCTEGKGILFKKDTQKMQEKVNEPTTKPRGKDLGILYR